MADDVNAKQPAAEQAENNRVDNNSGAAAADRFRDELINNPNGAKIESNNSMTGKADSSNLPQIDLSGGKAGSISDLLKNSQGGGGFKDGVGDKNPSPQGNSTRESLGDLIKNPQGGPSSGEKYNPKDLEKSPQGGDKYDPKDLEKGTKPGEEELHKGGDTGPKDLTKDSKDKFDEMNKMASEELEDQDGVEELPTGDYIVRDDGKETLFTPNGDKIALNPDGTHTIKGDVRKVETNQDGVTTVKFGDGSEVSFDKEGFLSVQRGNQGVAFGRQGDGGGGSKYPDGRGPKEPGDGGGAGGGGIGKPWPGDKDPKPWPGHPEPKFPEFPKLDPKFQQPGIGREWEMKGKKS